MLRQPEGQRIDAHFAGARPLTATRIIADPLQFEQPRAQMADGVTADQQRVARGMADGRIQSPNDLGGGARSVGKATGAPAEILGHLKAPARAEVIGRVIVLDHLEAPIAQGADLAFDVDQRVGHARVEQEVFAAGFVTGQFALQPQRLWELLRSQQRTPPDARPHAALLHPGRERGHVGEARVSMRRRPRALAVRLIAHVEHHPRAIVLGASKLRHQFRVAQQRRCREVLAVRVIPVVATIDRLSGQARLRAHAFAERPSGAPCGLIAGALVADYRRGVQLA